MVVSSSDFKVYLDKLTKDGFHGKLELGIYDGAINSIKVFASVDLEYLKEVASKEAREKYGQTSKTDTK